MCISETKDYLIYEKEQETHYFSFFMHVIVYMLVLAWFFFNNPAFKSALKSL
jgi:hypothetical protein